MVRLVKQSNQGEVQRVERLNGSPVEAACEIRILLDAQSLALWLCLALLK